MFVAPCSCNTFFFSSILFESIFNERGNPPAPVDEPLWGFGGDEAMNLNDGSQKRFGHTKQTNLGGLVMAVLVNSVACYDEGTYE